MNRRSRSEIINQILKTVGSGASKTKIMYNAYLSYSQLNEYMAFLVEHKFIRRQQGTEIYNLTESGQKFHHECQKFVRSLEETASTPSLFGSKDWPKRSRIHRVYKFRG